MTTGNDDPANTHERSPTMPLTSPDQRALAPAGPPPPPRTSTRLRLRWRARIALLTVVAALLALVPAHAVTAATSPTVVGSLAGDCAPNGFARPGGAIPPGYIYSPTSY